MPEFALQPGESLVRKYAYAIWFKSTFNAKTGSLILTNKRLVFDVDTIHVFGMLRELIAQLLFPKLMEGGVRFDVPLHQISEISKDSFGLSTRLVLGYSGGQTTKFAIGKETDFTEWETALRLARSGVPRPT